MKKKTLRKNGIEVSAMGLGCRAIGKAIREILTADGRSLFQGALGWLCANSPAAVPIPGFKNRKQITENCGALEYGLYQYNR